MVFASGFIIVTKDFYTSAVSNQYYHKGTCQYWSKEEKGPFKKIEKIISNMHEPNLYPYMTHRLEERCTHIRNTSNSRRKTVYQGELGIDRRQLFEQYDTLERS